METTIDKIDTPNGQESNPGNCPQSNPLGSMENIQKIPPEVLVEVFSYLTHTEKLISRLVCTDWNREISSILANMTYFTLTTAGSRDVILDSEVPWAKIKISNSHELALSTKTRSFVTTIALEVSGSDMKESMRILSKFPQLIDLDVSILGGDMAKRSDNDSVNDTCEQFEVRRTQFRQLAVKLKNLTITFPFGKFSTLLECLTDFLDETKFLIKLTLREESPSRSELGNEGNSENCSMTAVSNIISKSSRTLKLLELEFVSKIRNKLFTELISTLSTLEDLKLESCLIHWNPTYEIPETSFDIHQNFLKSQIAKGFMKSLSLPWCSNASVCKEFVRCLPGNIKLVGNVSRRHVSDAFYTTFPKCGNMAISSRNASVRFFTRPCSGNQQFQYCLTDDDDELDFGFCDLVEFYKDLGNPLINVTVLHFYAVRTECSTFSERDLQRTIENFQQLQILEIRLGCSHITDYSICGIEQDYADELKQTKNLISISMSQKRTGVGVH